jgi:hypothetical protein
MAADYGADMAGGIDLTPTLQDTSGIPMMREVCVRRLYTPLFSLLSAPDEVTCDLREFLSTEQGLQTSDLTVIRATAMSALKADSRVLSLTIEWPTWEPVAGLLIMAISGVCGDGPFRLVIQVSALTVDVLE